MRVLQQASHNAVRSQIAGTQMGVFTEEARKALEVTLHLIGELTDSHLTVQRSFKYPGSLLWAVGTNSEDPSVAPPDPSDKDVGVA
ncbi:hypothetical protein INR49_009083, partial [Caranx melampygus]